MRISRLPIAALLALAPALALAQGAPAPIRLPKGSTGPADSLTVTAPGTGMVGRGLADRAGDRRSVADASPAACGGTADATAAVNIAAAASALGTQVLVVNCPLTLARPDLVSIPASVHLAFEGKGRLSWDFGTLTAVRLDSPGRAYASLPTASIAGNAALGAVSMRLYEPTVAAGGTGYAVGNTLALVGGTGTAPTLTVTAIGPGGAVTGVSIADGGSLTALPTGSIVTTGGAGSGARVTATWSVASIAVASGGSYASAAVPAITLSGGSPAVPAVATAVGRQLYVSGAITAAPEQQIFGGYARLAGGANAGRLRAAWFGAGTFNPDNTSAIQAGIDSAIVLEFGPGFYQVAGSLTAKANLKLIGPASTGATDGGAAQFGAQIWGTGSGQYLFGGPRGTNYNGLSVQNLSLSTSGSSSYVWTVELHQMASSEWANFKIQNNWGATTGGAAHFGNENPTTNFTQQYAAAWINSLHNGVIGAVGVGKTLVNETTDSRLSAVYISGGTGAVEAGQNNSWSTFMVDNVNGVCLTVQPSNPNARSFVNLANGNFQNCTVAELAFRAAVGATGPTSHYANVAGMNFNNSSPGTADIILDNSQHITFSGNSFSTSATAHFASIGAVDYINVVGNDLPLGPFTLSGSNNFFANNDGRIGGGPFVRLHTKSGVGAQVVDVPGVNVPFTFQGGIGGAQSPKMSTAGGVGMKLDSDNTISIQQNGTNILDVQAGGVTANRPLNAQVLTLSSAPTAASIPANTWTVVKRTDDGSVKSCANDNGTIKCSAAWN